MRYLRHVLVAILAVLLLAVSLGLVWALNPRQAEQVALNHAMAFPDVKVGNVGNFIVIEPRTGTPTIGLLFYPGMHVTSEAYIFKLARVVQATSIAIVIGRPPLSMAFFSITQAEDMKQALPSVERWYVGGHSLGGSMACLYASSHLDTLEGVILLGTYCGSNLASTQIRVLSLSGENDGLFPPDKILSERSDLPATARVEIIPGMNHAQFGNYGSQFGDTATLISDNEATYAITAAFKAFLAGGDPSP